MRRLDEIGLDQLPVSARTRQLVGDLRRECEALDERVRAYDEEFAPLTRTDEQARRLASILANGQSRPRSGWASPPIPIPQPAA